MTNMLDHARIASHHNTKFGINDLNNGMMRAAIMDYSVGGCAFAKKSVDDNMPSDRWFAHAMKGAKEDEIQEIFQSNIARQIEVLRRIRKFPKEGLIISLDIHKIARYDRKPGSDVRRSKYKNGTTYFESYMTVQCVNDKMRLVLAALPLKSLDSVPECVDIVLKMLAKLDVKINIMLLDREFFSVESISNLKRNNIKFLMPCRNTGNVVAALNAFSQKKRDKESENTIEGSSGSANYTMLITDRKNAKASDKPEKKFIGFATNCTPLEIEIYAKRWGIESGYSKLEEARAKTRIVDIEARLLCFYYSLVLFNEWVIARAILSVPNESQSPMTMMVFKTAFEAAMREPKPPT